MHRILTKHYGFMMNQKLIESLMESSFRLSKNFGIEKEQAIHHAVNSVCSILGQNMRSNEKLFEIAHEVVNKFYKG